MKAILLCCATAVALTGCVSWDYESKVVSMTTADNVVSRAEADNANCIALNTYTRQGSDGYELVVGIFDLVDGKPVCGVKGDIVTADGHKFRVFFNRFQGDINEAARIISESSVMCTDNTRTRCMVGPRNRDAFKLD